MSEKPMSVEEMAIEAANRRFGNGLPYVYSTSSAHRATYVEGYLAGHAASTRVAVRARRVRPRRRGEGACQRTEDHG